MDNIEEITQLSASYVKGILLLLSRLLVLLLWHCSIATTGHWISLVLVRNAKHFEGILTTKMHRLVGVHPHLVVHASHHHRLHRLETTRLEPRLNHLTHHWLETRNWLSTIESVTLILRISSLEHHLAKGIWAWQTLCLELIRWWLLPNCALPFLIKAIQERNFVILREIGCFRS